MTLTLPYGTDTLEATLGFGHLLGVLDVADVPTLPDADTAIRRALECPIGLARNPLHAFKRGETVAIVVSDAFRETRADVFLPVLMEALGEAGIRDEDMLIMFATGTHRPPTETEQRRILGEAMARRFHGRIFSHDAHEVSNLRYMGTTRRGTPVLINRRVRDCTRIIATGSVVMHYFGGFGGGRKAIVPGLAGVDTISHNHAMNLDPFSDGLNPNVRIGALDGNPVAEDMLEAARLVGVDMILNTVLNRRQDIAGVFAGELDAAHRAAAAFAQSVFAVTIPERADLVIASSGGSKNFVQSHKALFNAYQAMKPGGRIVLAVKCPEGLGGEQFVKWLRLGHRAAIVAELRKRSEINGQTALSTIEKSPATIFLTEMSGEDVGMLGGRKAPDMPTALDLARRALAEAGHIDPSVYVMPSASYTVPFLAGERQVCHTTA